MNFTGMKTECGNYIVDSIVDIGPTILDVDIKKELIENDLYVPDDVYTQTEETSTEGNRTLDSSCGAPEINEEFTNNSENNSVASVNSNETEKKRKRWEKKKPKIIYNESHMVTRRKSRALLHTDESSANENETLEKDLPTEDTTKDEEFQDRPYMCSACFKAFPCVRTLKAHKRFCSGSSSGYTCHRCNRVFFSTLGLAVHSKIHFDPETQFETTGSTVTKRSKVRGRPKKVKDSFVCDICGKLFRIRYALMLHKMIHVSLSLEAEKNDKKTVNIQSIKTEPIEFETIQESNSLEGIVVKKEIQNEIISGQLKQNNLVTNERNERQLTNGFDKNPAVVNGLKTKYLGNDINSVPVDKQTAESSTTDKAGVSKTNSGVFFCAMCDLSFVSKIAYDNHHLTHKDSTIKQLLQEPPASVLRDEKGTFYYKILPNESKLTKMYTSMNGMQATLEAMVNGDIFDEKCIYICHLCKMGFNEYGMYLKHMQMHSTDNTFLCGVCGKSFQSMGSLSVHMKSHAGNHLKFKCAVCGLELSSLSKLTHHKARQHMHRVYKCDVCGKGFFRSWHLKEHRSNHTEDEVKECDVCGTSFPEIGSLRKHMWSHLKEAKRGIQGAVSTSKGVRSLQERAGEKTYSCDLCSKVYHSHNRLALHKRTHSKEKLSKCKLCEKEFFSPSELNRHHRTHTGEKPFQCGECGKSFALMTTLKDHIRSHTGEKPFKCFMCDKSFSSSSILGRHKRTHTGRLRFQCGMCDKTFPFKSCLEVHLRSHTGERPFSCEVCDKNFSSQYHKHVHMRIHTGEKPYKCQYCDKTFSHYGNHYRHIRMHPEFKKNLPDDSTVAISNVISLVETKEVVTEQIEEID